MLDERVIIQLSTLRKVVKLESCKERKGKGGSSGNK